MWCSRPGYSITYVHMYHTRHSAHKFYETADSNEVDVELSARSKGHWKVILYCLPGVGMTRVIIFIMTHFRAKVLVFI